MRHIYIILLGLLLGSGMSSCYSDKGNYDYHWIQDIKLDSVLSDVTVARSQVLKIDVDLKKAILNTENETEAANPEDYTYEWKVLANKETALKEDMVLSTEKDLNDTIWLGEGTYQVNYTVMEKASGVAWIDYFNLKVVTRYTGGHVFLTEDAEQNVEIELWAIVPDDTVRVHETGVLARSGFPYTHGGANCVKHLNNGYLIDEMQGIWVATGENTGWLNLPDFDWKETNLMSMYMLVQEEEDYVVENIVNIDNSRALLLYSASGALHVCPYVKGIINSTITYVDGVEFEAAPYYGGDAGSGMIVYDRSNKRFVSYAFARATLGTVNASCYASPEGSVLEGYDLVCMSNRNNSSNSTAVVKSATGTYSVCNFEIRTGSGGSPEGVLVEQYDIEGDVSSLENAPYTAIDRGNGFFYWAYGNKVYVSYHPSANVSECVEVNILDKEGNPVTLTDEICVLTQCNNNLCIATWSEANKGKAYIVSTTSSDSRQLNVQYAFETINPVKSVTTW